MWTGLSDHRTNSTEGVMPFAFVYHRRDILRTVMSPSAPERSVSRRDLQKPERGLSWRDEEGRCLALVPPFFTHTHPDLEVLLQRCH